MRQLSSGRYAAVTSTLALLVALGGTSYAAVTVGTKNIANNAVTSPKIAKNTVKSADVKDNGLTGTDVNESTLGKVPTAATADSAATAATATSLAGGARIVLVNHRSASATDAVIGSLNGLSLRVSCATGIETLSVLNASGVNGSEIAAISNDAGSTGAIEGDFDDSYDSGDVFFPAVGTGATERQYTISYSAADGRNVTIQVITEDSVAGTDCNVSGHMIG